jgi:hypothetical protein
MKSKLFLLGYLVAVFELMSMSRAQDFLTNGLVAYYPFNGNAIDESGNGNDGRVMGAVLATDRFGNPNSCYSFDGTAAYIKAFADSLPSLRKTISLWFYESAPQTIGAGLVNYGGGNCGTSFLFDLGPSSVSVGYHCNFGGDAGFILSQPPTNVWTHLAVTVSESRLAFFVNGASVYSVNQAIVPTSVQGTMLSLGASVYANGIAPYVDVNVGYFKGKLDEIRIYNRALTDAEISELYAINTHLLNTLSVRVKTVQVDMFVTPGKQYQLESSKIVPNAQWTPVGAPFKATSTLISQDFDVSETGMYFRYHEVP